MPQTDASDDLITVTEAAKRCRVTPMTIRRYIASGALPATRIGTKIWRIRVADLQKIATPSPGSAPQP